VKDQVWEQQNSEWISPFYHYFSQLQLLLIFDVRKSLNSLHFYMPTGSNYCACKLYLNIDHLKEVVLF
jgi:hypothetical protein